MSEGYSERSVSQTVRAQLALRDMILSGRLRPGERISELQAVEITGVSRTPVRLALVRLEDEGLLQAIPSGGFMVKAFTERDILDSIELRGTLEGLAARFAAERGASARSLEPLKECLADLDQLVRQDRVSEEAFSAYVTLNALSRAAHRTFRQRAADPPDRPRLGAAVRLAQRVRDGAVGAAGGASDPADRAGSSHRGGRDREPRRWARRGRDARAFPPRRAQSAAVLQQSRPSRPAARTGPAQIGDRRIARGHRDAFCRAMEPVHGRFYPRRDANDPRNQIASRRRASCALPGRQPHRRRRADRWATAASLLLGWSAIAIQTSIASRSGWRRTAAAARAACGI